MNAENSKYHATIMICDTGKNTHTVFQTKAVTYSKGRTRKGSKWY